MNTQEGRAWLALAQARGLGAQRLWQVAEYLAAQGKTASWLLRRQEHWPAALGACRSRPGCEEREAPAAKPERRVPQGAALLHPQHPFFPRPFWARRQLLPLPALLYAQGDLRLLQRPAVAIVGSRDASPATAAIATKLAAELATAGVVVVSGYAAGIDCAAHLGALQAGGATILVLAEGLARFRLKPGFAGRLDGGNGLIVSPFPPDARWAAFQAMGRNKVIMALCGAAVVVAAGPERDSTGRRSGAFDAALAALRLRLPLFVVDPSASAAPAAGNREIARRGGMLWTPGLGAAPILSALRAGEDGLRPAPLQKGLFDADGGSDPSA